MKDKEEIKAAKYIKHLFYQVGMNEKDIAGEFFKSVYDKCPDDRKWTIEIQQFKNSDTQLNTLRMDNRVRAFYIETRTDFNDIEYITGEVLNEPIQEQSIPLSKVFEYSDFIDSNYWVKSTDNLWFNGGNQTGKTDLELYNIFKKEK